jgi:hypothetical protein
VRYVTNFVALAEPDDVREVVLNDPQVIAVVVDVVGRSRVSTADNALLAEVGRTPIDFSASSSALTIFGGSGKPSPTCARKVR